MGQRIGVIEPLGYFQEISDAACKLGFEVLFFIGEDRPDYRSEGFDINSLENRYQMTSFKTLVPGELEKVVASNSGDLIALFSTFGPYIARAASIAKNLGLVGCTPDKILRVQDKFEFKKIVIDSKIDEQFCELIDIETALAPNGKRRYPGVIKPNRGLGSLGVEKIDNENDYIQYFQDLAVKQSNSKSFLSSYVTHSKLIYEQYLDGEMFSVEILCQDSVSKVLTVTRRYRSKQNEAVELSSLIPADISNEKRLEIEQFAIEVTSLSDLENGIFHLELIYDERPHLLEFNPRIMGGTFPILYESVYKVSIFELMISLYAGRNENEIKLSCPTQYAQSFYLGTLPDQQIQWSDDVKNKILETIEFYAGQIQIPEYKLGQVISGMDSNFSTLGRVILTSNCPSEIATSIDSMVHQLERDLGVKLHHLEEGEQ